MVWPLKIKQKNNSYEKEDITFQCHFLCSSPNTTAMLYPLFLPSGRWGRCGCPWSKTSAGWV